MNELNLIIIWENARDKELDIIQDIDSSFRIAGVYYIQWDKEKFGQNLTRFYGEKLPSGSHKEKHCGNGEFVLVTFYDENPHYESRPTSRGVPENVNVNVFDKKVKYREWTGGGHKIHSTNGEHETNHDLVLLLGKSVKEYNIERHDTIFDLSQNIEIIDNNLYGADGWSSFQELFCFLNKSISYLVLRNFEELPENYLINDHGDIDFLTSNIKEFAYISNAEPLNNNFRPQAYLLKVNNEYVEIDIRDRSDGYYDPIWSDNILDSAILNEKGIYIPSTENFLPSLVYHALIHKYSITEDYNNKFLRELGNVDLISYLNKFMVDNDYRKTKPRDVSVYFNEKNAKKINCDTLPISKLSDIKRVLRQTKYNIRSSIRPCLGKMLHIIRQSKVVLLTAKLYFDLRSRGYSSIRFHAFESWHNETVIFTAVINDKKYLIKSGKNSLVAKREFISLNLVRDSGISPKALALCDIDKSTSYVVMDFLDNAKPIDVSCSKVEVGIFLEKINNTLIDKNIIHRDIRPDNILYTSDDRFYLIDYGWAIVESNSFDDDKFTALLTRLGSKYRYTSEEWRDSSSIAHMYKDLFGGDLNLIDSKSYPS
ncbi:hypothetical protein [Vibrio tasmaniensis]|uniref:hypothetical protein n=1 Tax=Vibrio tasmaniensis TaxID=212663 RepID=UPI00111A4D0B|nr:hypothetical protein [Vibrio tasmaniensis]